MTEDRYGYYIRTYTGRTFWPGDARVEDIHIEDIAHALALCNRFAGHTTVPYSVAQHSVMIARTFGPGSDLRKCALLHDAAEAYIGDLTRPLKKLEDLEAFNRIEAALMRLICTRFGLPVDCPEAIKEADQAMLRSEQRDLVRGAEGWRNGSCLYDETVRPWPWWQAEMEYLLEFAALWPDWAFTWPDGPQSLIQVAGEDLFRLLGELHTYRAERRQDTEPPLRNPVINWGAVAAGIRALRGER